MSGCSFGMCAEATCEKCKPKLLICPECGMKTYIADVCMFCKGSISKEHQAAAVAAWRSRQEELRRSGGS